MGNFPLDTDLFDRAAAFALKAHAGTERRCKGFPYIVHPMEAAVIASTMTSDPEILSAAMLHDTVEDTDTTLEQLKELFGDRVASLVKEETDHLSPSESEAATWHARKQAAIDRIAAAPMDAKIVAMADKLSNMRQIARDYRIVGDELWSRFHAPGGKADHEWHYRSLALSLVPLAHTEAFAEFVSLIQEVFGDPKPQKIDIADYTLSGDGYTALSYNDNHADKVIKLYSTFVPYKAVIRELKVAVALSQMGLRVPAAYRLVTDGERNGVEFERLNGKRSFARIIAEEPEKLEEYTKKFVREAKKLHGTQCNSEMFPDVKDVFRGDVSNATWMDPMKRASVLKFLDSLPDAHTFLHGDLHVGNILDTPNGIYWIDLADFSKGDPIFDFGMFYFVSNVVPDDMVMKMFHMPKERILKVWDIFMTEYYGSRKAEMVELASRTAALYMIRFSNRLGHPLKELPEILEKF